MPDARYDGKSDWYEVFAGRYVPRFAELVAAWVAPCSTVVDIGCGTGLPFDALRARGITTIVGLDLSHSQLQLARRRNPLVVRGDAAALPIASASVECVTSHFVHTDIDDFAGMVAEVGRVLAPGARFVYVGTHPCYVGVFADRTTEAADQQLVVRPGYGHRGVRFDGSRAGVAEHVGTRSVTLAQFVGAFVAAGLQIESLTELDTTATEWTAAADDGRVVPSNVLVVARRG